MTAAMSLESLLQKFADAEAIWYSSVRPDGRPHLAPIWHVWQANAAWVVTRSSSVRARNLAGNPHVALSLADPMHPLILEGRAAEAVDAVELIRPLFKQKYNWDIATDNEYQFIIRVTPTKLLAWGSHGDGRWRFDGDGWRPLGAGE